MEEMKMKKYVYVNTVYEDYDADCVMFSKDYKPSDGEVIGEDTIFFDTVDEFYLNSKNRLISGKVKKQQHSRSYVSSFYVFKKSRKKKIFYLDPFDEETREEIVNGLLRNNVK